MIRLKVREIAKLKGIGQNRLARMADTDVNTIRRIYRDPHAEVSSHTLDKLAMAFDLDVSQLIESVPPGKILSPDDLEAITKNSLPLLDEPDSSSSEEEDV